MQYFLSPLFFPPGHSIPPACRIIETIIEILCAMDRQNTIFPKKSLHFRPQNTTTYVHNKTGATPGYAGFIVHILFSYTGNSSVMTCFLSACFQKFFTSSPVTQSPAHGYSSPGHLLSASEGPDSLSSSPHPLLRGSSLRDRNG